MESSTSKPAKRMDISMSAAVRVPPNASRAPPGLSTRHAASHVFGGGTSASHSLPMKPRPFITGFSPVSSHARIKVLMGSSARPSVSFCHSDSRSRFHGSRSVDRPYGVSVTMASTLSSSIAPRLTRQSPVCTVHGRTSLTPSPPHACAAGRRSATPRGPSPRCGAWRASRRSARGGSHRWTCESRRTRG